MGNYETRLKFSQDWSRLGFVSALSRLCLSYVSATPWLRLGFDLLQALSRNNPYYAPKHIIYYYAKVISKSESVKFSLIESVICLFTDSSVKKYFSLSNQSIFSEIISEIWLIYSNLFLAIWISQISLIISRFLKCAKLLFWIRSFIKENLHNSVPKPMTWCDCRINRICSYKMRQISIMESGTLSEWKVYIDLKLKRRARRRLKD